MITETKPQRTIADSQAQHAILPIDLSSGLRLDPKQAYEIGTKYRERYNSAEPFPHIVMDDFLPAELVQKILANFPADPRPGDLRFEKGYSGYHKRAILPGDCNEFARNLFYFFNSDSVLQFLEGLTGITGLISDPYYQGGGFHEISTGGLLGVHADFRVNEQLVLQRRLNLLIYLNPNWKAEWGGQLGLWDKGIKNERHKIDPICNRAVVFNTDATSFHGHPGRTRSPPDR